MAKPVYFYGTHAVSALLAQRPTDALTLFVQMGKAQEELGDILEVCAAMGISVQPTQKSKLAQLCDSPNHQGVVLHARPLSYADEGLIDSLAQKQDALFLLLDQVTDAHNLGACLRSAAAMGVSAVICPKNHTAPLSTTVAKVSVGAAESVPVVAVTNLARSLDKLKQADVFVFGTALDATAKPLYACDFTGKVALVMGSEGDGMRRLTADSCDQLVYIPMPQSAAAHIQSLNVSVATGMALYEVARQRLKG